jgi:hypothetical protein
MHRGPCFLDPLAYTPFLFRPPTGHEVLERRHDHNMCNDRYVRIYCVQATTAWHTNALP